MRKMRTIGVLIPAVAMFMLAMAVPAAGGPNGELRAAFQAGLGGGETVVIHSTTAAAVASPARPYPGRILPWVPDQEFCSDQPLGIWVFWVGEAVLPDLDTISNAFVLDGVELDAKRTPNKRLNSPNIPGDVRWFAEGVPVLGLLDVGSHEFTWSWSVGADDFEQTHSFEVVDC